MRPETIRKGTSIQSSQGAAVRNTCFVLSLLLLICFLKIEPEAEEGGGAHFHPSTWEAETCGSL